LGGLLNYYRRAAWSTVHRSRPVGGTERVPT